MGMSRHRDDWRERNLSTLVLVFVRAVRDPALAWDLAAETMAAATLAWTTFPGGSRMAWVLEHGRRVLRDAQDTGRVSSQERTRNRAAATKTLTSDEQRALLEGACEPLDLDPEASAMVDALARGAPAPGVLLEIGLSPLTIRGPARTRSPEHDDG
jgi:hypothetical protein